MLDSMRLPAGSSSPTRLQVEVVHVVAHDDARAGTTTPDAKNMLIVFVTATMFPSLSITLKDVVDPDSYFDGSPAGTGACIAASGLIRAASVFA